MNNVSKLIKIARVEKDMTQKKLAEITGYAPMYINEIERGIKKPRSRSFVYRSICDVLEISYSDMISAICDDLKSEITNNWNQF